MEDPEPEGLLRGTSNVMRQVREDLDLVADSDWTVLLEGSTGTGKTVAASYIHMRSKRRNGPFVVCSASQLMDGLALSELVGHTRGAFTGADADYAGAFEAAHHGTLFIDEIHRASPAVQGMLLPLIPDEPGTLVVKRLGDRRTRSPDVRVIAASNVELKKECHAGRFGGDLFERLNVLPLRLPDLVERREDIPMLLRHYAAELRKGSLKDPVEPHPAEWHILKSYSWPGNVREVISAVKYYMVFRRLRKDIVPDNWRPLVPDVLRDTNGNKSKTASLLGVSRPTLNEELRRIEGSRT
jgi:DNA-binding NtrC family response regulator